jgi:hypothetical protein
VCLSKLARPASQAGRAALIKARFDDLCLTVAMPGSNVVRDADRVVFI